MMTATLKAAAKEVKLDRLGDPRNKHIDALLAAVDALPSDSVLVSRAALERVRELLIADQKWHAERSCPGNGGYAKEGVCICADMENNQTAIAALDGAIGGKTGP